MIAISELRALLADWEDNRGYTYVAIDDGGLSLVTVDDNNEATGPEIEIGGMPDKDDEA